MGEVPGLRGDVWPDSRDELLLRFLLQPSAAEALTAWQAWRPGWDPDDPSSEQYRLYPLMAERVAALVPDEPKLSMLQGVRRQSTIQTLLILDHLEGVLATLEAIGIDAVVLKGPALALTVYDHVGQRPFHDLDLFVDPRRHTDARTTLLKQGWVEEGDDFIGLHHVAFGRAGVSVELHRKQSSALVLTGKPTSAWDTIETARSRRPLRSGRFIRVLDPADALLHTIAHGSTSSGPVPLRWVVDAQRLIASGDVDWERVLHLAGLFEVGPMVHDGLEYVRGCAGAPIPEDVSARLAALPVRRYTRRWVAGFHKMKKAETENGLPWDVKVQMTLDQPVPTLLHAVPAYMIRKAARRAAERRG